MQFNEPLEPGGWYHIYNRGVNGCDIFSRKSEYDLFLEKYDFYLSEFAETIAYCLLKNHFHILIHIRAKLPIKPKTKVYRSDQEFQLGATGSVSKQFSHFFNFYTQNLNQLRGRKGSLFERRFKRKLIYDENQLKNVVQYIHFNPVRHGFTENLMKWPHSSYTAYINESQTWLERDKGLDIFGGLEKFKAAHEERQNFFDSIEYDIEIH
jgi:REP element-mobilizing transposase RayT